MSDQPDKLHLIKTIPLQGRRLIEASAGTGKTFTLAGIYLRMVLGLGCAPRIPPDILVLTFTRAATRELRDRIRARLTAAASAFRTGSSTDELLQWLIECFEPDQHPACARTLDIAAGWMDEAAIHTIHAWCQTMLQQHAFDSGSLFGQEVDNRDATLMAHALADYWREHFTGDEPDNARLLELAGDPDALGGRIKPLLDPEVCPCLGGEPLGEGLEPSAALAAPRKWLESRQEILEPVRKQWLAESDGIRCLLEEAMHGKQLHSGKINPDKAAAWFAAVDAWAGTGESAPSDILAKFRRSYVDTLPKKGFEAPAHGWFDCVESAFEQLEALGPEPAWQPQVLAHAASRVRANLAREKQRANRLEFNDLLIELDRALDRPEGGRLRETILAQYPVALVDEFQDTDPVQFRIFNKVWDEGQADDPENGLFLIGDPKQSIYSFRGADIHAYLKARDRTTSQHSLDRNFRSTAGMVESVNHLFGSGENHPLGAFAFVGADGERRVPFEAVEANGRDDHLEIDGQAQAPMTFWYQPEPDGCLAVGVTAYRQRMADQAAEGIASLLQRASRGQAGFCKGEDFKPVQPADIAVLVRTGRQAGQVRLALQRRGVASVYLSDRDSIFDTEQATELGLVLHAVADAGDERLLRSALATRLFGWSLSELDTLHHDEARVESLLERFTSLRELWRRSGVLAMVHRLLAQFEIPARLLARREEGERALTNLLHLAELLQAESQSLDGEHALVQWLQDQITDTNRGEDDEQVLRLESDAELVRVVTIHASKGLEYPLVFAPFACDYRAPNDREPVAWHDGQQRRYDFGPDEATRIQARREELQEQLRLFYVAVTRACHACWIGCAPVLSGGGKNKPPELHRYPLGHLLLGLADDPDQPEPMRALLDRLVDGAGGCMRIEVLDDEPGLTHFQAEVGQELGQARVFEGKARDPWWIASYSALKQVGGEIGGEIGTEEPQSALEDQAREEADEPEVEASEGHLDATPTLTRDAHGFPRGPQPGTFLHGLLEWAGRQGLAATAAEPGELHATIERRCSLRGWQSWTPVVQGWMDDLLGLQLPLGEQPLRLADLSPGRYTPELEFWFQASRVATGELDTVVRNATLDGARRPRLAAAELNGMMRGFIDLVFEHEGRYFVLDYKSNHLGPDDAAYSEDNMCNTVLEKRYDMQYALYTLALHRLLSHRLPDYDYQRHVGGAVYLFLRGCGGATGGVFHRRPSVELIEALDGLFAGREINHAA